MATGLPLRWGPSFDPEKFFISPSNQDAVLWLNQPQWPCRHVWISGPEGCGKTHLAAMWALQTKAQWWTPGSFTHLTTASHAVIDWGDNAPEHVDQSHLYAFLDHIDTVRAQCVWICRYSPGQWSSPWPDVVSRIRAMMHISILPPDDELLGHVLRKMLSDEGWKWPDRWIQLVLTRMVRSCEGMRRLMECVRRQTAEKTSIITEQDVLAAIQLVQNHTSDRSESSPSPL